MPISYIKVAHNECEITNFKDVTIVINLKKRVNYISFDITNNGAEAITEIEIVVPFHYNRITKQPKSNTIRCREPKSAHSELTSLFVELNNPLKQGKTLRDVQIGFEVIPPKKGEECLSLDYYNLLTVINSEIENAPPIHTQGIMFCVVLPNKLREEDADPLAKCHKNRGTNSETISKLISDSFSFLKNKNFFEEDKEMSIEKIIEKRVHEIFVWSNEQLPDIEEWLRPTKLSYRRCIHFKIKSKNSIRIPVINLNLSYDTITGIIISAIISIIISIVTAKIFKC